MQAAGHQGAGPARVARVGSGAGCHHAQLAPWVSLWPRAGACVAPARLRPASGTFPPRCAALLQRTRRARLPRARGGTPRTSRRLPCGWGDAPAAPAAPGTLPRTLRAEPAAPSAGTVLPRSSCARQGAAGCVQPHRPSWPPPRRLGPTRPCAPGQPPPPPPPSRLAADISLWQGQRRAAAHRGHHPGRRPHRGGPGRPHPEVPGEP